MKGTAFLLVAASLLSPLARAERWKELRRPGPAVSSFPCIPHAPAQAGGTQGYADSLSGDNCYVDIHPIDSSPVYRDYAFFGDGMLMVFNSYCPEDNTVKCTSAREFYFFPRRNAPELFLDPAAPAVSVKMPNGGLVVFDPATAQIRSVDRGGVTVSPRIDPADRGGVEFPSYNGLMLDAGFRMGELPSGKPDNESVFRSAYGQQCKVKNREIFSYANGESSFKFVDQQLSVWLKTRCPGLYVDF